MTRWRGLAAGIAGAIVAAVLDPVLLPLATITAGVVVAVVLTRRLDAQADFDAVGASFALTLGAVIPSLTVVPEILARTPQLALLIFGAVSGFMVAVRWLGGALVRFVAARFTDSDTAGRIWDVLSTLASVVVLAWTLVRIKERLVRTGALAITGPLSLVLNLAGRFVDLPWFLDPGVDLLAVVYVACVVVGFHTLASWYNVLTLKDDPVVRAAGSKTREAASTAGSKTRDVAETAGSKTRDVAETARETTGEVADSAGDRLRSVAGEEEDGAAVEDGESEVGEAGGATDAASDQQDGWALPGAGIMGRILGVERPETDAQGD